MIGVFFIFLSASAGPVLLGHALISATQFKHSHSSLYVTVFAGISLTFFACLCVLGSKFINAHPRYYWYQGPSPKINTLNQLLAGVLVTVYTPFTLAVVASLTISVKEIRGRLNGTEDDEFEELNGETNSPGRFLQPNVHLGSNIPTLIFICSTFLFFFVLTLFLPPNWANTALSLMNGNAYFATNSPWSLIQNCLIYSRGVQHFVYFNISSNTTISDDDDSLVEFAAAAADDDGVVKLADPNWLQPTVYLKLYTDVVVFYSFILGIMLVGVISTYWMRLQRWMHYRLSLDGYFERVPILNRLLLRVNSNTLCNFQLGVCVGEVLLMCSVFALFSYWFWFWAVGWGYRDATITEAGVNFSGLQRYSRAFGELSTLAMAFLLFPVTHNSVWESVFGMPFERSVLIWIENLVVNIFSCMH